jgi:predicted O-methyltransferase YrrM
LDNTYTPANFDLKSLLSDPPRLHDNYRGGLTSEWRIDDTTALELNKRLKPGLKTLETGAGLSTIIFGANGCDHTSIVVEPTQIQRIQNYCRSKGIDTSKVKFIIATSPEAIHRLPRSEYDLVLIDGCHGFPSMFVDFYYGSRALKTGGTLMVDDLHIYTCLMTAQFMQKDPGWNVELMTRRIAIATKISDTLDVEWTNQPFVVKRSAKPNLLSRAWYSFLISSKPLRSRLGLSGLRRPKN